MALVLFLAFVVLPFADLVLLLRVGSLLGFWTTVALTLASGFLGAWLAKREGLRVLGAWRRALEELRPPEQGLVDGVLVIAGGALLMAPGVLTDLVGFVLLIPLTRKLVAGLVRRWIDRRIAQGRLHVVTSVSGFEVHARPADDAFGFEVHASPVDDAFAGRPGFPRNEARGGVVDTEGESVGEAGELPEPNPKP